MHLFYPHKKDQAIGDAGTNNNILGRFIPDISSERFALCYHDSGIGGKSGNSDGAICSGDKPAIVGTDGPSLAVLHDKFCFGKGLLGHSISFEDGQGTKRIIVKPECLRIPSVDHDGLGSGVDLIVVRSFRFRHNISAREQLGKHDLALAVGGVEAVGGCEALIVRNKLSAGGGDPELSTVEGLSGHGIILLHNKSPLGGVGDNNGLGVTIGANDHIGAGAVHDIPSRSLGFGQHIRAGGQIGNANLTVCIGGEQAVLRQRGGADHAIQTNLTACGGGHTELSAGKGLAGLAVPFLNYDFSLRLVLKSCVDKKDTCQKQREKMLNILDLKKFRADKREKSSTY